MSVCGHFKDHFSRQAATYQQSRPTYPPALFAYLAGIVPGHELAWDCGTGNGQSAIGLAEHFMQVIATDPSAQQVAYAIPHERVRYRVEPAEQSSLPDHAADLVTVAQALHWFDWEKFYAEVKRVLKPGGIIAAWAYGLPEISAGLDQLVRHFHDEIVGPFWQAENRLIENGYATIPFPFDMLPAPDLYIRKTYAINELPGWLRSWSATQRYIDRNGHDPVELLIPDLLDAWGDKSIRQTFSWKLILKAGRCV